MIEPLPRWPPYVVAVSTFLALAISFALVANVVLAAAVTRGVLPEMPEPAEIEAAMDVAFGSPAKKLAISIVLNSFVIAGVALLASIAGLRQGRIAAGLVHRLRLNAPSLTQVIVAVAGLLGLTSALDSTVQLLDLENVGTLADIRDAISPLSLEQRVIFAGLIGIGPGVTEELFFRGYLLNRIEAAQSTRWALAMSSIIFGLFHADPVHTPLAVVMGLYLGLCLLHTGSLWVPIAAHVANNAMAAATTGWIPTDAQAGLLIPLGLVACGSAITLLSRSRRRLPRGAVVW